MQGCAGLGGQCAELVWVFEAVCGFVGPCGALWGYGSVVIRGALLSSVVICGVL